MTRASIFRLAAKHCSLSSATNNTKFRLTPGTEFQCTHNLNYWSFGDYLAVGAGAHGKIQHAAGIGRYVKPANPMQYMETIEAGAQATEPKPVDAADRLFEFMLNVLRLNEGLIWTFFSARTGPCRARVLRELRESASAKGLIEQVFGRILAGNGAWSAFSE